MTTPSGVPNLPAGALTVDTLGEQLQDTTTDAIRSRAVARVPGIFTGGTGGNPADDLAPSGVVTKLYSGFNSVVAQADPADIEGPQDLPGLLLDFIEKLPVIGQFVELLEAIAGTYDGNDPILQQIQNLFGGVRNGLNHIREFIENLFGDFFDNLTHHTPMQLWQQVLDTFLNPMFWLKSIPIGSISSHAPNLLADFLAAESLDGTMAGQPVWSFDPDIYPQGSHGSVRITAQNITRELISDRIELDVDQSVHASVKVKYANLSTLGAELPIRLGWIGYDGDTETDSGFLDLHQPTGPDHDWLTLDGSLTRQDTDPWDRVAVDLYLDTAAIGGTVWWSAPSGTKPDKLPQNLVSGLGEALGKAGQSIRDAICNALGVGGTGHSDADVIHALTNIPAHVVEGVEDLAEQVGEGFKAWYNTWFGRTDGTGSASEVQYTVEAIKDAVINGENVHVITASETGWPKPDNLIEFKVLVCGGGENGHGGSNGGGATGGAGGNGGGWIYEVIDLTDVAALDFQIGTAGNLSYVREADPDAPHTGAVLAVSPEAGALGGIATGIGGYAYTTSTPGAGGTGGGWGVNGNAATAGAATALAVGGTRGGNNGIWGTSGGDGGSVSAGVPVKSGGAGGGGGGGAYQSANAGGRGGDGGYPGGGGGGGGNCNGLPTQSGSGGSGAIGMIVVVWR